MSYYKDIYNDFPLRCGKLWKLMRGTAEQQKLDVTFMLMTAAAGFSTPFEHLKIQEGQAGKNEGHPAFFNYEHDAYKAVLRRISSAFDVLVPNSPLFSSVRLDSWFYCTTRNIETIRVLVESNKRITEDVRQKKARDVIKILRNAIAHNNIYAFNRKGASEIDELVFFSEIRKKDEPEKGKLLGYEVLAMPAQDLGFFLDAWFGLLSKADAKGKTLKLAISDSLHERYDQFAA